MSPPRQSRRVWFLHAEPPGEVLPAAFQTMGPVLSIREALQAIRNGDTPAVVVLMLPPGSASEELTSLLHRHAPALKIATLNFWEDSAAIRDWVKETVVDSLRSRKATLEPANPYQLSEREREILSFMVRGLIKKEIAFELDLSYHTVDNHQRHIFHKLGVHTRSAAVAKAIMERLC